LAGFSILAKASEQFRASDVTFWGVVALVMWTAAVLGANLSALVPNGVLGALHVSRLEGGTLGQLRGQIAALASQTQELKQQNSVLTQRVMLGEQSAGEVTRRVGALEQTLPKIYDALNAPQQVDRGAITASTGAPVLHFNADGGSVSYSTTPMLAGQGASAVTSQEMPSVLPTPSVPDPSAFGIALGPPVDAAQAAGAWDSMTSNVGTLLIGLGPILGHVEGGAGRRLVAGPIASEADARELCGRMAMVGIACATVPFTGDPMPGATAAPSSP
jgi:hypothetical protein